MKQESRSDGVDMTANLSGEGQGMTLSSVFDLTFVFTRIILSISTSTIVLRSRVSEQVLFRVSILPGFPLFSSFYHTLLSTRVLPKYFLSPKWVQKSY